jgi:hypothetical protein
VEKDEDRHFPSTTKVQKIKTTLPFVNGALGQVVLSASLSVPGRVVAFLEQAQALAGYFNFVLLAHASCFLGAHSFLCVGQCALWHAREK